MMTILVTDYLERTAKKFPDKVAFADDKVSMTFSELRDSARRIATVLVKHNFFKQPVVVYMEKSPACIAAFMGVAYSGNFYTPIDVSMPEKRVKKILETLQPVVIITDKAHKKTAELIVDKNNLLMYEDMCTCPNNEKILAERRGRIIDTDILYVLFTSGSTGVPKGVIVGHRALIAYIEWVSKEFKLSECEILGNQTPFYFSMSVLDIYQTIRNGSTLYIIPKMLFSFPIRLLEYINEKQISFIYWVPSALCLPVNLKAMGKRDISCLKKVLFAGEVMPVKQLNVWRHELPNAEFSNLFGPTEVTDICSFYRVNRDLSDNESVPIGRACDNTGLLILDSADQEVVGGEMGELCVRGSFLSYGYYKNPQKTAEVFVQNPLNNSYPEIIYRTGDLVRYNEFGELVYVCRKDFQIKHMGHRIELGEIETAVSSIDGIYANVCLYDDRRNVIVLFYTGSVNEKKLAEQLRELLPGYMLPGKRCRLSTMPLNLNGKIDRQKLKAQL